MLKTRWYCFSEWTQRSIQMKWLINHLSSPSGSISHPSLLFLRLNRHPTSNPFLSEPSLDPVTISPTTPPPLACTNTMLFLKNYCLNQRMSSSLMVLLTFQINMGYLDCGICFFSPVLLWFCCTDNLLLYLFLISPFSFYKDYRSRVERLEKDKLEDYQHKVKESI
jgi:hypothetical protein